MSTYNFNDRTELTKQFELGMDAARTARSALEPLATSLHGDLFEDVRLLVTEVVTNGVRHSGKSDGVIELEVRVLPCKVCVEVTDPGSGFEPVVRPPDPTTPGSFGLYILDRLADRWGVGWSDGTRVWFELNR